MPTESAEPNNLARSSAAVALRQPGEQRLSHVGEESAGSIKPGWSDSAFAPGIPRGKELLQQLVDEAAARAGRENSTILGRLIEPQDIRGKELERTVLIALQSAQRIAAGMVRAGLTTEPRLIAVTCPRPEGRPLARRLAGDCLQRPACECLVVEYQDRRNRLQDSLSPLLDLVDQRRDADDGVVFEQERRHSHFARGRAEEIRERGAGAIDAVPLRGPSELPENRGRIEDVSARPVGPLAIDQPRALQMLEVAKRRAG